MRTGEPYIRSLNGVKIEFFNIQPKMIKVEAIFLHLAKTCRYHGMLDGWYSNAEHSILASMRTDNKFLKRECLIHDFGEHITADVAGPLKKQCPDYDKLCEHVQMVMNFHFLGYHTLNPEVKEIDLRLTATEQRDLRKSPSEDWDALPYDDITFWKHEWRDAYKCVKTLFCQLFPEYRDAS